jgi:hypothetical protein
MDPAACGMRSKMTQLAPLNARVRLACVWKMALYQVRPGFRAQVVAAGVPLSRTFHAAGRRNTLSADGAIGLNSAAGLSFLPRIWGKNGKRCDARGANRQPPMHRQDRSPKRRLHRDSDRVPAPRKDCEPRRLAELNGCSRPLRSRPPRLRVLAIFFDNTYLQNRYSCINFTAWQRIQNIATFSPVHWKS